MMTASLEPRRHRYRRFLRIALAILLASATAVVIVIWREAPRREQAYFELGHRIAATFDLSQSFNGYVKSAMAEVIRRGMCPTEVDSILARLRGDVRRVEWLRFRDSASGPWEIVQSVALGTAQEDIAETNVHYLEGRVAYVSGHLYGTSVRLPADSARLLLMRCLTSA